MTGQGWSGGPRFGALSHHSFFSRHNPHPHRVRHIQGLNGRPVCTVRDDWPVGSDFFPHPLLKSPVRTPTSALAPLPANRASKAAAFSEAWRDELRELAAKVALTSQAQEDKNEAPATGEPVGRQTRYSAQTGRLLPPTAASRQRRTSCQRQPFQHQELAVLELLCQILRTDSLQAVQRWLLLAGRAEKELVTGLIGRADLTEPRPPDGPAERPAASAPPASARTPAARWRRSGGTSGRDRPVQGIAGRLRSLSCAPLRLAACAAHADILRIHGPDPQQ